MFTAEVEEEKMDINPDNKKLDLTSNSSTLSR